MSKAKDDEMTFVLLGRDLTAPATIRFWCMERVRLGKNKQTDPQIVEALECALAMERERPRPKPVEAFAALREAAGDRWEGVDADVYVREVRGEQCKYHNYGSDDGPVYPCGVADCPLHGEGER